MMDKDEERIMVATSWIRYAYRCILWQCCTNICCWQYLDLVGFVNHYVLNMYWRTEKQLLVSHRPRHSYRLPHSKISPRNVTLYY
jgi:hypothetical protein